MRTKFKNMKCTECTAHAASIFKDLDQQTIDEVASKKVMASCKKGGTLFNQGGPALGIHCIGSGKVKIGDVSSEGNECVISIASCGDILGHRYIFEETNYTSTATVIEESSVCFIERKSMLELIEANPLLAKAIFQRFSQEIETSEIHGHTIMAKPARPRVAELLLQLSKNFGVLESGRLRLDLSLTRIELASMIGMASETMIRLLTEFKHEQIIEQIGKDLFILDKDRLEAIAR